MAAVSTLAGAVAAVSGFGIGSLLTIGAKQVGNLSIVVLDNGQFGETGMQTSHSGFLNKTGSFTLRIRL